MYPLLVQQYDSIDMPFCMPAMSQCSPSAHLGTHVHSSVMSTGMTHGGLGSMPLSHTCLPCPRVTMWWPSSGRSDCRVPVLAHSSLNTPVYTVLCPRAANSHGRLCTSFCLLVSQGNHNVACRGLFACLSYPRAETWQSEHTCSQAYCVHCCHVMEVCVPLLGSLGMPAHSLTCLSDLGTSHPCMSHWCHLAT